MKKKIFLNEEETNYYIDEYGNFFNEKRQLKTHQIKNGYVIAQMEHNGKKYNRYVHRLVGEYFLKYWNDDLEINHKDFDKTNNYYKNLECLTKQGNMYHLWLNKREEICDSISKRNNKPKKIKTSYQIIKKSFDGKLICIYSSFNEALKYEKIKETKLRDKCKKFFNKECCYGNKKIGYKLYSSDGKIIYETNRYVDMEIYLLENNINTRINIKKPKIFFQDRFYYGEKTKKKVTCKV